MMAKSRADASTATGLYEFERESWVARSIDCPFVAAFHAGRLLHVLDWSLLRLALQYPWQGMPFNAAANSLISIAEMALGPEAISDLKSAIRQDLEAFGIRMESELAVTIHRNVVAYADIESIVSCALRNIEPTFVEMMGPRTTTFLNWRQMKQTWNVLNNRMDATSRLAVELGYCVDDGVRSIYAEDERVTSRADQPLLVYWVDSLDTALSKLGICNDSAERFRKLKPEKIPAAIDKLDRTIRDALVILWADPHSKYLNLEFHPINQTVCRHEPPNYSRRLKIPLGKNVWFVRALAMHDGFLSHKIAESIYKDPERGHGGGGYKGAFNAELVKINKDLIPCGVTVISKRNRGWNLIDSEAKTKKKPENRKDVEHEQNMSE